MIDMVFMQQLADFSDQFPNSLVRLWSTPAHNAAVGGAANSGHLSTPARNCNAADLVFDTPAQLKAAAKWAYEHKLFDGIEVDVTNNHLHLDSKLRKWQVVHHGVNWETPLDAWLTSEV